MIISQLDKLHLRISAELDILEDINDHFTAYVPNHYHMPQFRAGVWDGKVRLFSLSNRSLPYGLLADLTRYMKKNWPDEKIHIDETAKEIYKGKEITPNYNLSKQPYYYQKDCIETALKFSKGLIRSATASGKSLVISYIIKTLMENNITKHSLIVVPTIGLVEQFYKDMIEYGVDCNQLGRVYEKYKDWDSTITISTWQTLMTNHRYLPNYDCVIFDECHQVKSQELTKIAKHCTHATYRFGFTGTLPNDKLDLYNVKSYVGPVLREYGAGQLSEEGYISKCNINVIRYSYVDDICGEYNDIKQFTFQHSARLKLLFDISEKADSNILILVGLVEKEGDVLYEYIKKHTNKTVVFLNGKTKVEEREFWRLECEKRKNIILIATYGIFSLGLNIPSLKYVILGSPFKSEIRILQSIGRALRLHADKVAGAVVWDILDDCRYLDVHGRKRIKYYENENFNINYIDLSVTDFLLNNTYDLP